MSADPDILSYYSGLLIHQYKMKSRAVQTIQLVCNCAICDGLAQNETTCFDLDTALGVQLDVIGRIVGIPRNVYGLDLLHVFWEWTTYTRSPTGSTFDLYAGPHPTPLWRLYETMAIYSLSDDEMRSLIKMKIVMNNSFSSLKNIVDGMWAIFGSSFRYSDYKNMSVGLDVYAPFTNAFKAAAYLNILPVPMGVSSTIAYH